MTQKIEGYVYEGDYRKLTCYGRYPHSGIIVEEWGVYRRIFDRPNIEWANINGGAVRNMRVTPLVKLEDE